MTFLNWVLLCMKWYEMMTSFISFNVKTFVYWIVVSRLSSSSTFDLYFRFFSRLYFEQISISSKFKVTMDIYRNKLVSTIETKPLCASSSNLADMLTIRRRWTLLILEVTGQRWRSWWRSLINVGCAGMQRFALLYLQFISEVPASQLLNICLTYVSVELGHF